MTQQKKILFLHHPRLEHISGVNVILAGLMKLVPLVSPTVTTAYQCFRDHDNHTDFMRHIARQHGDASIIIGVNLHIERDWQTSINLIEHFWRQGTPIYIYIHDYWPHHKDAIHFLQDQFGVQLLASSHFICHSLLADGFQAQTVPVGIAMNNILLPAPRPLPTRKIIASSGRLVRRKRYVDIVRAFAGHELHKVATLYLRLLPGNGSTNMIEEAELKKIKVAIEAHQRQPNAYVIDHCPVVKHDYGQYDIYVCASHYEGFSLTPIEAAYSGCTPIMSDIPPHRFIAKTLFGDRCVDFTYAVGDHEALGALLQDEIETDKRRSYIEQHQAEIQKKIQDQFSLLNTANLIVDLL